MPFVNRLLQWAEQAPDRAAVVVGGQVLTYGELVARAQRTSLPDSGGKPALIALELAGGIDLAVAFTAAVGRGATAAVLDPGWPAAVRRNVLSRLAPDAILGNLDHAAKKAAEALQDSNDDRLFYCGFTSGTTNLPKAFLRTTGSWRRSFERSVSYFSVAPGARVFSPGPLSASLSLYVLAESLFAGATFHALPPGERASTGHRIRDILRSARIEHLVAVPSAIRMAAGHGVSLPDLRTVVSGGSKLIAADVAVLRAASPEASIFEYYGASELGFVAVQEIRRGTGNPSAVGMPFPGVQFRIEPRDGRGHGTVWVRSDLIAERYVYGDDGLAFRRTDDGWATVGDQGWVDDGGALHLTGRQAEMIVAAGHNVYPAEVEEALAAAGYPRTLVIGLPDERRGARLAAVLELAHHDQPSRQSLADALKTRLTPAKLPLEYYRCACLPTTPGGKPDRNTLRFWLESKDGRCDRIV